MTFPKHVHLDRLTYQVTVVFPKGHFHMVILSIHIVVIFKGAAVTTYPSQDIPCHTKHDSNNNQYADLEYC